jgi:hypothetical protein
MSEQIRLISMAIALLVVSGLCDSLGFTYAAKIWRDNQIHWHELLRSACGFAAGISIYWLTLRYFSELGVVSAELQTLIWFGTTLIGVGVVSGKFLNWRSADQIVAMLVLMGIAWLLVRVEN